MFNKYKKELLYLVGGVLGAGIIIFILEILSRKSSASRWIDAAEKTHGTLSEKQKASISGIVSNFATYGDGDSDKLAYIIESAWHESRLEPKNEIGGANKSYGQIDPETGQRYFGRGLIQITHKYNYLKWGGEINKDLVHIPNIANQPIEAAEIATRGMLGVNSKTFTGKQLSDYLSSTKKDNFDDFYAARSVLHGGASHSGRVETADFTEQLLLNYRSL